MEERCHTACRISFSGPGIEPGPQQGKPRILTTEALNSNLLSLSPVLFPGDHTFASS